VSRFHVLKLARWQRSLGATHRAFTFYLGIPRSSIETRSAPALTRRYPRSFTFYLGIPGSSILFLLIQNLCSRQ
jgi:hypothetical protein